MANKTLFVGNLPFSASETSLLNYFSAYGASNARIMDGRGFGFVDVNADQFDAAVSDKNNSVMDDRNLTVNAARERVSNTARH